MPRSSASRSSVSSTAACTVTSRALVASSAMRRRGLAAIAIAIMTRWRMPPLSSCGYWSYTRSPSRMPTSSKLWSTTARASAGDRSECVRSTSRTCRPTRKTGFKTDIGSWKIIEMAAPRVRPRVLSSAASMSVPSNHTCASGPYCMIRSSLRRRTLIAATDLPDPDSPMMPTRWPGATWMLTPSTAGADAPANVMWRFSIDSRLMCPPPNVRDRWGS